MPEYNTIKLNQIDQVELLGLIQSGYESGIVDFIADYVESGGSLGDGFVYTSDTGQEIDGLKTFVISPRLPYSGETGAAVSRKYVDDQIATLDSGLDTISSQSYVYRSGDQSITGNKNFVSDYIGANYIARYGYTETGYGIDLEASQLIDSSGETTLDWELRSIKGEWSFDDAPLINGVYPVLVNTDQTINGVKTFAGTVNVPSATSGSQAVSYAQYKADLESTGQQLVELLTTSVTSLDTSGFAGVLSLNGYSGHVFTQGRGNVTVTQNGNILSISGNDTLATGTSLFQTKQYALTSGSDVYRLSFGSTFSSPPVLVTQLQPGTNYLYENYVSGIDTSGFSLILSDTLAHTGYVLTALVIDATGILSVARGEQGLQGSSLISRGEWVTGAYYASLDFASIDANSWVCRSGHASTAANNPTGVSGSSYWNLLVSGKRGFNGGSIMAWAGEWDDSTTYESGTAVFYSGSSYGTSETTTNESPTGAPWFLVAQRGDSGISFRYLGDYSTGTSYSEGDVVRYDNASYILPPNTSASGLKENPLSVFSEWDLLQDRGIVFNGNYLADKVYNQNDLAYIRTGYGVEYPVQYIRTGDYPSFSLHPHGFYNAFLDCDDVTGYNLFELSVAAKDTYHTNYGQGSASGIKLNSRSRNQSGCGFDTLTLIRDKAYYFDNEDTTLGFILATEESGATYYDQYVGNVRTGTRLLVGSGNYTPMAYNQALFSGTMWFTPTSGTPDELFLCSPFSGYLGWKLRIVDETPWDVFTSGVQGLQGESGESIKGDPGVAFAWQGTWNVSSGYVSGDSVFYSGSSYATNASVSGTMPPNSPWFVVASKGDAGEDAMGLSFTWKGTWQNTTEYIPYDSVYYNGGSYGTTGSPTTGTLPTNLTYWFPLAVSGAQGPIGPTGMGIGFTWMGAYSPFISYPSGSAVYFQGSSYGTTGVSSGVAPTGTGAWGLLAAGGTAILNWRSAWNSSTFYHSGDAVAYSGSSYTCYTLNVNENPVTSAVWQVIASKGDRGPSGAQGIQGPRGTGGLAFEWRGDWDSDYVYAPHDSVFYDGSSYGTLNGVSGAERALLPPDNEDWFLLAEKGDPGLAFTWKGNWHSGTLYRPYESVYYSGRSYATLSYVATGVTPTTAPWFVVAGMGGDEFVMQQHLGTGFPTTGFAVYESFCTKAGNLTGLLWTAEISPTPAYGLSGSIYKKDLNNTKTPLMSFKVTGGSYYWTGNANHAFDRFDRLGFDLSGNYTDASGVQKLHVGMLGHYSGF